MESRTIALFIVLLIVTNLATGATMYYLFAPEAEPEEEVVKVGMVFGLTGASAREGQTARAVYEMIINEINEAGGVESLGGMKIQPIFADHQWKPEVAAAETERLITEEGVHAIFGCTWSSITLPAAQKCEQYGIPMVCGDASNPDLTDGRFDYFFRIVANDDMFGKALFDYMNDIQEETGEPIETIAYLYEDSSFGAGCYAGWKVWNADPEIGGYEVVEDLPYAKTIADASTEVLRLKNADPDVILWAGYSTDGLLFAQEFETQDWLPKAILTQNGVNKPDFIEGIAGTDRADYYLNVLSWNRDVDKAKSKQVRDQYEEIYGESAYTDVIGWYSSFYTFWQALEDAGSLDPDDIRDALRAIEIPANEIPSVGSVKFDENGQNINIGLVVTQFFNGTDESRAWKTVYPFDVAAEDAVFPMPSWQERP
ncbi:MAG: ABC transporter substrate-binding protein [Candidatus Bathyarchaeota archaeon]|nr:MAG: ABC transporter substrate-binding protein [Candidatus Bathyarchaeota archaeon]